MSKSIEGREDEEEHRILFHLPGISFFLFFLYVMKNNSVSNCNRLLFSLPRIFVTNGIGFCSSSFPQKKKNNIIERIKVDTLSRSL